MIVVSRRRLSYLKVGDAINNAKRLIALWYRRYLQFEAYNKRGGNKIIILAGCKQHQSDKSTGYNTRFEDQLGNIAYEDRNSSVVRASYKQFSRAHSRGLSEYRT